MQNLKTMKRALKDTKNKSFPNILLEFGIHASHSQVLYKHNSANERGREREGYTHPHTYTADKISSSHCELRKQK